MRQKRRLILIDIGLFFHLFVDLVKLLIQRPGDLLADIVGIFGEFVLDAVGCILEFAVTASKPPHEVGYILGTKEHQRHQNDHEELSAGDVEEEKDISRLMHIQGERLDNVREH